MKIISPLPQKKARLEIIPLIDIMFFLLASFMLVSLSMTKQRTVDVNLPAADTAQTNLKPDNISLAVTASGQLFIEKQAISLDALEAILKERLKANKDLPVFISGDAARATWVSENALISNAVRNASRVVATNSPSRASFGANAIE